VVPRLAKVAEELNRYLEARVVPGAELTHVPVKSMQRLVKLARRLGAELVLVHGETIVEPVHEGTNDAALACSDVDILAHPGFLTPEQADKAREADIYLELTSRRGHCIANGWVARIAMKSKAKLLVNTDAHSPEELLTLEEAMRVAKGAGLGEEAAAKAVGENPKQLLRRL
ncbi:MAG: histidinol phosphate phosphatase domain-containing protein, partial [Candidatus Hadarchaeales archaeon]